STTGLTRPSTSTALPPIEKERGPPPTFGQCPLRRLDGEYSTGHFTKEQAEDGQSARRRPPGSFQGSFFPIRRARRSSSQPWWSGTPRRSAAAAASSSEGKTPRTQFPSKSISSRS